MTDDPNFIIAVPTVDFIVNNHGTLFTLHPLTPAAQEWIEEHLPEDRMHWAGGVVIEHRFVQDIVAGIQADGLTVH